MATIVETAAPAVGAIHQTESQVNLDAYDDEQVRLMEERCILVDEDDKAYGDSSKKRCKLASHIVPIFSPAIHMSKLIQQPITKNPHRRDRPLDDQH